MSKIVLIIAFLFIFVIAVTKNRFPNKLQRILIISTLIFVITFRDPSMADYKEYVKIFQFELDSVEPFHTQIISILKYLEFDYLAYFFVIAALTVILQWQAIKEMAGKLWALSLLTWLGTSFILNDMITIRAGLAAALLLWIIKYITDRQLFKSIIICLLAMSSHLSAAIYIPLLLISSIETKRKLYISLLIGSCFFPILKFSLTDFLGTIGIDIFDQKILVYLQGEEANIFSLFQLSKLIIALILWLNVDKLKSYNRYFLLSLKIYTIGCIWFFVNYKIMAISWRISCLLWTCDIIIYPMLAYIFSAKLKPAYKLIPACLGLVMFIVNLTMQQYWDPK